MRLSPTLRHAEDLPRNILLIVPTIDIIVQEQLSFIERLREEMSSNKDAPERRFEAIVFDQGFHGWLEGELIQSWLACCVS